MLFHKSIEKGVASTSGVAELFTDLTSHLTTADLEYFTKWYELSILEASYNENVSQDKYFWLESPVNREKRGTCFSGMLVDCEDKTSDGKLHYTFKRRNNHFNMKSLLRNIPLAAGDRVIVSEECGKVYNITTGK